MIKLTVILCACLYLTMVIWGDHDAQTSQSDIVARSDFQPSAVIAPPSAPAQDVATAANAVPQNTLVLANGGVLEVAAVIRPAELDLGTVLSLRPEQASAPTSAAAEIGTSADSTPELAIVYVSGSMVNMRSGPTTSDAVVGAVGYGASIELIEDLGNGWSHIRDIATGQTGYMASRFLTASLT